MYVGIFCVFGDITHFSQPFLKFTDFSYSDKIFTVFSQAHMQLSHPSHNKNAILQLQMKRRQAL